MKSNQVLYLKGEDSEEIPLPISKIECVLFSDPYCYIYTLSKRFVERMPMQEMVAKCSVDSLLLRVHRSAIIRFDCEHCIQSIKKKKNGQGGTIFIADRLQGLLKKDDDLLEGKSFLPVSPEGLQLLYQFEPPVPPRQLTLF